MSGLPAWSVTTLHADPAFTLLAAWGDELVIGNLPQPSIRCHPAVGSPFTDTVLVLCDGYVSLWHRTTNPDPSVTAIQISGLGLT